MHGKKILLTEGKKIIADRLCKALTNAEYEVDLAFDGSMGRQLFDNRAYDLALIDFHLPDINGCELCSYIRNRDVSIPLMMLSSETSDNKLEVFQSGVDDFMVLSDDFRELLMRIRALVKRSQRSHLAENCITAGDIMINLDSKEVTRQDRSIFLTEKEFRLLEYLVHNKNKIVSRDEIAHTVWGSLCKGKNIRVAAFINSLRGKIEDDSCQKCIYTVTGKGYLFEEKPR
jgi:two-component system, OmpR family, copper resistance phosphate regulon response regulator CusR